MIEELSPGVFKRIEAIPVDRFARDTASVRAALRHLKEGRILGVFPEGRIERTRELYALAIRERYRFYSFGDAMLVL